MKKLNKFYQFTITYPVGNRKEVVTVNSENFEMINAHHKYMSFYGGVVSDIIEVSYESEDMVSSLLKKQAF